MFFFTIFLIESVRFWYPCAIIDCNARATAELTAIEYRKEAKAWADDAMRFAIRCHADQPDCEDAVQEGLTTLWGNRDKVPLEKGKSYLLSVTYRCLMSTLRHKQVVLQHAEAVEHEQEAVHQPDERFDLREAIDRALLQLPEVQRAILQLRDVEGYSYAEIAEALELSDNQVQVYLFRARVAMRKQLKNMGYDKD